MSNDTVIVLPSGTEISVEAAQGDLQRAEHALIDSDNEDLAADLIHVRELLDVLVGETTTDVELSDLFLTMVGDARMKAGQHAERYKRQFIDTGEKKYDKSRVIWHNVEIQLQSLLDAMNEVNLNH